MFPSYMEKVLCRSSNGVFPVPKVGWYIESGPLANFLVRFEDLLKLAYFDISREKVFKNVSLGCMIRAGFREGYRGQSPPDGGWSYR